ncbi:ABC transporter ATP-binding protein [Psychrobacillus psychrodurans]|uniref:ABC transporter ATP-binding protein n=1 Tax=Psychrobacillus psychrodurans TaxID=126157 RepID=UPI001F4E61B0|nr:ABC transporter ATP-binding protein [Psychrobacillus psychrodurans]MCK1998670.1 ABC transporter ATP-binding protein [Psychrobacillus psychrodurans]
MSLLQVHQLRKKYGNLLILQNISFNINEGEIVGLVGPNGAGKSTLLRSILAIEEVESGSVKVKNISNQNSDFYKFVSFIPSDNYLYMQLTGYDHLAFVANIYQLGKSAIEEVIDQIGISTYVDQPVKTYSYGLRQHLLIALSILTKPSIILMDEPFNGLDPTSTIELKELIRKLHALRISFIISTHNLDILEDLTKTIWFIREGMLFKDDIKLEMKLPYQIEVKVTDVTILENLMTDCQLPHQISENIVITDHNYDVGKYLEWLLMNKMQIQSVNQIKPNLEERYKHFYEVLKKEQAQ